PFSIVFGGSLQNVPISPFSVTVAGEAQAVLTSSPSSQIPTSEVQRLTFNPNIASGRFTIGLGNLRTGEIIWSSSTSVLAANIQNALNDPAGLGPGSVSVTVQTGTTNIYNIAFRGSLGTANFRQLSTTVSLATGTNVTTANFVTPSTAFEGRGNEVQTFTIGAQTGQNEVQRITRALTHAGTTQFNFNGTSSTAITLSAATTPAQIQANLFTIPA